MDLRRIVINSIRLFFAPLPALIEGGVLNQSGMQDGTTRRQSNRLFFNLDYEALNITFYKNFRARADYSILDKIKNFEQAETECRY